jgi:hypothetical protein
MTNIIMRIAIITVLLSQVISCGNKSDDASLEGGTYIGIASNETPMMDPKSAYEKTRSKLWEFATRDKAIAAIKVKGFVEFKTIEFQNHMMRVDIFRKQLSPPAEDIEYEQYALYSPLINDGAMELKILSREFSDLGFKDDLMLRGSATYVLHQFRIYRTPKN